MQNPSTRQRHGIIALRHIAPVPPRYPRTQHTVRIQNRTSQADESCIGHGKKQEPTAEHSLTLALWHSRSYRPSSLCYQSIPPLSLGIAFIRPTADTSLLALLQSTLSLVPQEHTMRVQAWCARARISVSAGSKQHEKWDHSFGGLLAAQYLPKENQKSEANFCCPHFFTGTVPCHL